MSFSRFLGCLSSVKYRCSSTVGAGPRAAWTARLRKSASDSVRRAAMRQPRATSLPVFASHTRMTPCPSPIVGHPLVRLVRRSRTTTYPACPPHPVRPASPGGTTLLAGLGGHQTRPYPDRSVAFSSNTRSFEEIGPRGPRLDHPLARGLRRPMHLDPQLLAIRRERDRPNLRREPSTLSRHRPRRRSRGGACRRQCRWPPREPRGWGPRPVASRRGRGPRRRRRRATR